MTSRWCPVALDWHYFDLTILSYLISSYLNEVVGSPSTVKVVFFLADWHHSPSVSSGFITASHWLPQLCALWQPVTVNDKSSNRKLTNWEEGLTTHFLFFCFQTEKELIITNNLIWICRISDYTDLIVIWNSLFIQFALLRCTNWGFNYSLIN